MGETYSTSTTGIEGRLDTVAAAVDRFNSRSTLLTLLMMSLVVCQLAVVGAQFYLSRQADMPWTHKYVKDNALIAQNKRTGEVHAIYLAKGKSVHVVWKPFKRAGYEIVWDQDTKKKK